MENFDKEKDHSNNTFSFRSYFHMSQNKSKRFFVLLGACLITGLLLFSLFLFYTHNLQTMVEDENYRYLQEISTQINSNMTNKLNFHYSTIKTLGNIVNRESKSSSLNEVLTILEDEKGEYNYQRIALIDSEGYLHSKTGKTIYSDLIPFIAEMEKNQKPITSNVMNLEEKDSVAFLSPLPSVVIEETTFKGIVAISDMNTLSDTLSLTMFENQGFAHVVTNTGAVVIRSNNENNRFDGYNILTYIEKDTDLEGITIDELRNHILNNDSGQFQFKRNDSQKMLSFYAPVGVENWYLFSIIPAEILTERTSGFYQLTVMACSFLTVIFVGLIIIIVVTQQQRKRELMHVLYTDPVTDGCSKLKFEEDVLKTLQYNKNQYALIYINIDKFKFLNEQYGRVQADLLLKHMYQIIANSLSEKSNEYVTRLMADHFGILVHSQNIDVIKKYVRNWNKGIKEYAIENNFSIPINVTNGVYLIDTEDSIDDIFLMLDKANVARKMSPRKDSKLEIALYDDTLKQRVSLEQELESRQEIALQNGEFKMFLQPKYNPQTNEIAGAEGLTRWITDKGMIYPDQFIPLFESNGFIVKLDLYIFEEACRFIDDLIHKGYEPIPISVNLSRANLNIPHFIDKYVEVWKKYDFDASYLEFEITENLIYENMEFLDSTIADIHERGFLVSMDDFGSGYSSLNMLKNVNVDFVKLDREFFLSSEEHSHKSEVIINAMIELCKKLGIYVVSEGIETQTQVEFLRQLGCDLIQGYYYSKPIPKEELMEKIVNNQEENINENNT